MEDNFKAKIAALEAELANKDTEIEGLRHAITKMPEFAKLDGDVCFKLPQTEHETKVCILCNSKKIERPILVCY